MEEHKRLEDRINHPEKRNPQKPVAEGSQRTSEELKATEEQELRKKGLMNEINDIEKMLELGRMAMESYEEYEKLFALPSYMEYENVQREYRRQESALGQARKFDHLIL